MSKAVQHETSQHVMQHWTESQLLNKAKTSKNMLNHKEACAFRLTLMVAAAFLALPLGSAATPLFGLAVDAFLALGLAAALVPSAPASALGLGAAFFLAALACRKIQTAMSTAHLAGRSEQQERTAAWTSFSMTGRRHDVEVSKAQKVCPLKLVRADKTDAIKL